VKEGANWTYLIAIGPPGGKRVVAPGGYAAAYPLACVGDRVVVPVRLEPYDKDHRFEMVKEQPGKKSAFAILKETADRGWSVKAWQTIQVKNGAWKELKVVASNVSSSVN